jgi:hypothetical protein
MFDVTKAQSVGRKGRKNSDQLTDIVEATLRYALNEEMSAKQILAGLNLPDGTYCPVGVIRQVIRSLLNVGEIRFGGGTYSLERAALKPELVKKPA